MQGVANATDWSPLPELESSARLSDRIGRRIENARRLRRMPQSELGSKIGSTQQSIWLIENGYQSPRLGRMFDIARVLGTTVSDLLQGLT
jgi:DNA-binding XRE family transcriptional regulator